MRKNIITVLIICCLSLVKYNSSFSQALDTNIEETFEKKDGLNWGDIFSSIFHKKEFEKSFALVIGIGNYKSDWSKLEAPSYDAIRIKEFLINDAGFDYVVTLTNTKATKRNINKLMEEFFPNRLGPKDRFFFYYSGHGTQRIIRGVPFGYLVLQDCGLESYGDMITMKDIERWDSLIYPVKHVLFVLDCCFSGLAGQQLKASLTEKKLERLSQYAHHLITAGTADEESLSSLNKWHGSLFTDSFLKAVSGQADLSSDDYQVDGVVSLKELMKYIGDRIDDESLKVKGKNPLSRGIKMSPQISDLQDNKGEFFFIAKNFQETKTANAQETKLSNSQPIEAKGELIAKMGVIRISSYMLGNVYINNKHIDTIYQGETRNYYPIPVGEHNIKIKGKDETITKSVIVAQGDTSFVDVFPTPKKKISLTSKKSDKPIQTGQIRLLGLNFSGKVYIDGVYVADLEEDGDIVIENQLVGEHTILVQGKNKSVSRQVNVIKDKTTFIDHLPPAPPQNVRISKK